MGDEKLKIAARVTFLSLEDGGRAQPPSNSQIYRPHLVVGDPATRDARSNEAYLGVSFDGEGNSLFPNTEYDVTLILAYYPTVQYQELVNAATFTIREGARIVGFGTVLQSPFA